MSSLAASTARVSSSSAACTCATCCCSPARRDVSCEAPRARRRHARGQSQARRHRAPRAWRRGSLGRRVRAHLLEQPLPVLDGLLQLALLVLLKRELRLDLGLLPSPCRAEQRCAPVRGQERAHERPQEGCPGPTRAPRPRRRTLVSSSARCRAAPASYAACCSSNSRMLLTPSLLEKGANSRSATWSMRSVRACSQRGGNEGKAPRQSQKMVQATLAGTTKVATACVHSRHHLQLLRARAHLQLLRARVHLRLQPVPLRLQPLALGRRRLGLARRRRVPARAHAHQQPHDSVHRSGAAEQSLSCSRGSARRTSPWPSCSLPPCTARAPPAPTRPG